MTFSEQDRRAILAANATRYIDVAIENITREYPVMPYFIATGPGPYPSHREFHPAFYGSFDWHSCVEMHWVIVRLLKLFPQNARAEAAGSTLTELLTAENITTEMAFFTNPNHRTLERPYGWGWLLTLQHELESSDDADGRSWAAAVRPLADLLATNIVTWLPAMRYPQRTGVHPNTAFALSRSYGFAAARAAEGDSQLLDAIRAAISRWFINDTDYPANYEPSGADFLSACLSEAELVSIVNERDDFADWLGKFAPGFARSEPATLFHPAATSDSSDGQMAHLHGLNLSRAAAFVRLADRLPGGDARIAPMVEAARIHAEAALPHVSGSDYMVEHWLAAYATLLLS